MRKFILNGSSVRSGAFKFLFTTETSLFSAIGHVDICYQGRVIYGNYDPSSETLFLW